MLSSRNDTVYAGLYNDYLEDIVELASPVRSLETQGFKVLYSGIKLLSFQEMNEMVHDICRCGHHGREN